MFKKTLLAATALLALASGSAIAAPMIAFNPGDIKFTFDNYDSGTTGYGNTPGIKCTTVAECNAVVGLVPAPGSVGSVNPGADTLGIFSIAAISNISTGETLFVKGGSMGFITGVFGNLTDYDVEVSCSTRAPIVCRTEARSTGGTFQLFANNTDYNPTLGPLVGPGKDLNALMYPGISGGELLLSGNFAPGAVLGGDPVASYTSLFNNNTFAGNGQGFLDVTGGLWASIFDTNALGNANGGFNDLFLTTTFDDVNGAASSNGFTVKSSGQISGEVIPEVPEPTSLALVALGLLGAGFAARRRNQA